MESVGESKFLKILESEKKFIANFSASWCSDCIKTDTFLEDFSKNNPQLKIYRIDVEENTDIANKFGIINVPSIAFFENRKITNKLDRNFSPEDIEAIL